MKEDTATGDRPYLALKRHYEACFKAHGDTHKGMDWPNPEDAIKRFEVMLGVMRDDDPESADVIDIGCGSGHLLEHIQASEMRIGGYRGIDISEVMIDRAMIKHSGFDFRCIDLLDHDVESIQNHVEPADYVVMNGLFTEKREMSQDQMTEFFKSMLQRSHALCRKGFAFNVMSTHIDWMRDDLYHLSYDTMATIVMPIVGRNHVVRADYGLYEYTVYAYR